MIKTSSWIVKGTRSPMHNISAYSTNVGQENPATSITEIMNAENVTTTAFDARGWNVHLNKHTSDKIRRALSGKITKGDWIDGPFLQQLKTGYSVESNTELQKEDTDKIVNQVGENKQNEGFFNHHKDIKSHIQKKYLHGKGLISTPSNYHPQQFTFHRIIVSDHPRKAVMAMESKYRPERAWSPRQHKNDTNLNTEHRATQLMNNIRTNNITHEMRNYSLGDTRTNLLTNATFTVTRGNDYSRYNCCRKSHLNRDKKVTHKMKSNLHQHFRRNNLQFVFLGKFFCDPHKRRKCATHKRNHKHNHHSLIKLDTFKVCNLNASR